MRTSLSVGWTFVSGTAWMYSVSRVYDYVCPICDVALFWIGMLNKWPFNPILFNNALFCARGPRTLK